MIADYLDLFYRSSQEFRNFIFDPDGIETVPVQAIQDIGKGALHNLFEYTDRWKTRTGQERNVLTAQGFLLDYWGKLFGIPRNSDVDSEYRDYIFAKIFPPQFTFAYIRSLILLGAVYEASELGFFLDDVYLDDSIDASIGSGGSALTAHGNAVYILYEEGIDVEWEKILFLAIIRPAGIAIYVGWKRSGIYEYLYLDDGAVDYEFLGDIDPAILPLQNEPEFMHANEGAADIEFIGQ